MNAPESGRPGPRDRWPAAAAAVLAGLAGGLAVSLAAWAPVTLVAGSPAAVALPGLDRSQPRLLEIRAELPGGAPSSLGVSFERSAPQWLHMLPGQPAVLSIPAATAPGLRLSLLPAPGTAPLGRLSLHVPDAWRWRGWPAVAGLACSVLVLLLARSQGTRLALGLGLVAAALLALATLPFLAWTAAPAGLAASLAPVLLAAGAGAVTAGRRWRELGRGSLLLAAVVLGVWARLYFLPSTGSWDTEYWKAWMIRAADHGVTHVYGGPEAVPPGRFFAQMDGREPRWELLWLGRSFTVDYPPLAMASWRAAWAAVRAVHAGDAGEARNIAVKLPAVLGDVAAAGLILWALRGQGRRGHWIAALYWALPVTWLSSAVLGFLDGAVAPLLGAAVLAAGRRRGAWAGAWLAAACLVKPTAVIVAPAILTALMAAGAAWLPAVAAAAAVVAAALVPFALSGTLATAIVHCYWILFQGTLSGGYPNVWWLVGHALAVKSGLATAAGRVPFARLDLFPVSARPLGTVAFAAAAAWVVSRQRRVAGAAPAALAAAALFFSYGMLAIGVHENHPHPLFLLLALTGLATRRLRLLAAGTAGVYVLNMLMLSGLGRFHGSRYIGWEPIGAALQGLRMAASFDATLLLAAANLVLWAWMMARLGPELTSLAGRADR
jgi:hypothetical protein